MQSMSYHEGTNIFRCKKMFSFGTSNATKLLLGYGGWKMRFYVKSMGLKKIHFSEKS